MNLHQWKIKFSTVFVLLHGSSCTVFGYDLPFSSGNLQLIPPFFFSRRLVFIFEPNDQRFINFWSSQDLSIMSFCSLASFFWFLISIDSLHSIKLSGGKKHHSTQTIFIDCKPCCFLPVNEISSYFLLLSSVSSMFLGKLWALVSV